MASIHLAHDTSEERDVALKLLHPALIDDDLAVARFRREAKAAHRFRHPGAVHVFDWGIHEQVPFIAMELVEGEDLFELLERRGKLSQLSAIGIACQLCDVLDAAHSMGFVHRDLKPENIMVLATKDASDPLRIKVLDFGVVKFLPQPPGPPESSPEAADFDSDGPPDSGRASLTDLGTTVGTPTHMAPEQARGDEIDTRADLYTCGILLFEMCTGELPFFSPNPLEVARMQARDAPPHPGEFLPEIHPELETVILRCLEKNPADRWQTARELGRQLARLRFVIEEDGDPTASSHTPSAPRATSTRPRRSTLPTAPVVDDELDELDTLAETPEPGQQPLPPDAPVPGPPDEEVEPADEEVAAAITGHAMTDTRLDPAPAGASGIAVAVAVVVIAATIVAVLVASWFIP
jgi:serine/threonine-protein kinase